jgi:uncharacterized membrane protein YhhN
MASKGDDISYQVKIVCISVLFGGLLYGAAELVDVEPVPCAIIKTMPALISAMHSLRLESLAHRRQRPQCKAARTYCRSMMVGFIFCSLGDFCLRLDDAERKAGHSPKYFISGLVAFLIGHVLFILAFVWDGAVSSCTKWSVCSYAYILTILYFALPNIDNSKLVLKIGVVVYSFVIGTMLNRAASLSLDRYPEDSSGSIALAGALVFLFSDTVLAVNRFVHPMPYSRIINISTYFLGIALLACSCAGSARWQGVKSRIE